MTDTNCSRTTIVDRVQDPHAGAVSSVWLVGWLIVFFNVRVSVINHQHVLLYYHSPAPHREREVRPIGQTIHAALPRYCLVVSSQVDGRPGKQASNKPGLSLPAGKPQPRSQTQDRVGWCWVKYMEVLRSPSHQVLQCTTRPCTQAVPRPCHHSPTAVDGVHDLPSSLFITITQHCLFYSFAALGG